jgi:DNA-binding NtrC family response regulator
VELSEALLALRPDLPILLVTGHDTFRGMAESTGIRSVLFKPLDPAALARAVRQQIDTPPPTQRS